MRINVILNASEFMIRFFFPFFKTSRRAFEGNDAMMTTLIILNRGQLFACAGNRALNLRANSSVSLAVENYMVGKI